jgi:peptidoglycan hydrolase-like protein with peptidoglycan-binding domain
MDKKTRNILIISGIILGIGAATIFILSRNKTTGESDSDESDIPDGKTGEELYADRGFPLKLYSKGKKVEALQRYLNDIGGYALAIDGKFGKQTETAVSKQNMFISNQYPTQKLGTINQDYYNSNILSYE